MSETSRLEAPSTPARPTALLLLADGTRLWGYGLGATGAAVGEVCFNTAMTGYQEILTDPSYAAQIITFTFPHIGNVGANAEDLEGTLPAARGMVLRADATEPSNWRASRSLDAWAKANNIIGISGVDTRRLTRAIRSGKGAPAGIIAHAPDGQFDVPALQAQLAAWPGLEGMDLAAELTTRQSYKWDATLWRLGEGYGRQDNPRFHVVAIDYGAKQSILRCLANAGCAVTVVPADTRAEEIRALNPDGVFLSNGPGDPAATGAYAVPVIRELVEGGVPTFGICLGHQLLALAAGGRTVKMPTGHRGANHPVQDLATGRVEITSQNHGFVVDEASLPAGVEITHKSLFDGSNEGIRLAGKPAFSVQYHPEASPGPTDSHYLFDRFVEMMAANKAA